jgi:DNA segregation ATPase FtsK/SpoIIIE, S-DNA-T family
MVDHYAGTPATAGQGDAHFTAAILQACLSAHHIAAMVALTWDGPQLLAFSVALGLGDDPRRVERLADALALAAGCDTCRVARAGGRLVLELPKQAELRRPLSASRLDALQAPTPWAVALGVGTGGKVVWLDLADERNAHLVIGGVTGSGKSCALQWLLYRLARQNAPEALRLLCLDPKGRELAPFAGLPHLLHPPVANPLEAARVLAWAASELDRRLASGQQNPRLVIVLEEAADVCATVPDAGALLARLAQVGRSAGITVIVTVQQPGARSLGDALTNFPARLLGRVASATLTYGAAGRARTMADTLLGRGDMLLLTAGDATRLQMPLITGRQLGAMPRADVVASLTDDLPSLAMFADRARDPRGGAGRRELGQAEYEAIEQALEGGASTDDLRTQFGIGWERARRLHASYWGQE